MHASVLAAAVHPRYWKLEFLDGERRRAVRERLAYELLWCVPVPLTQAAETEADAGSSDEEQAPILGEDVPFLLARAEVQAMKKWMRQNEEQDCPCLEADEFWKLRSDDLPHMSRLARVLLAVPATSATSERTFSTAGHCDRVARGRSMALDSLVFVRRNVRLLGETPHDQLGRILALMKTKKEHVVLNE
jgi:hypothetical protein